MNNEIKRKYRAKELAEYLSVGLSTIWKWAKDGKIRPHNISKGVLQSTKNKFLIIILK